MNRAYSGNEATVYAEAMRLVPAVAAARLREAPDDAFTLYEGYVNDAKAIGVCAESAWAMLSSAGIVWVTQLIEHQAQTEDICCHAVVENAVAAAHNWVASYGT